MTCNRRTAAQTLLAGLTACATGDTTAQAQDTVKQDKPDESLKTQVCVIGGGSGGIGAALAAARGGAQVVLLERESILGGTSTNAWVCNWEPTAGADGIPREIHEAMREDPLGVTFPDYKTGAPRRGGRGLPFEPRVFNLAAWRLLEATGRCRILLGTTFIRAHRRNNEIIAVDAAFHGRLLRIEADIFIDATADGDVCANAGCEFHLGEDPKSLYQEPSANEKAEPTLNSMTLCYRVANTGTPQKPFLPRDIPEGLCPKPVYVMPMPNGDHMLNAVDMLNGNALLLEDHSRLMHEAHRRVVEHFYWLQRLDPKVEQGWTRYTNGKGYATWTIVGIAPRIGVRESRRIVAEYMLTEHDCQAGVKGQEHSDIIAQADHAIDTHGHKSRLYEVPNGAYGIPYR
jgi:hypothetical protein